LLTALGGGIGGLAGGPGGSIAGHGLGNSIATWLGMGAYKVGSNTLLTNPVASMHSSGETIRVNHREYIGDVITSATPGAFSSTLYPLNPGLFGSYPWLSGIAQQFQEYTIKGMIYEFVSTSGDAIASSNTALGSVMMATQYRASATPFANKITMLNEFFSTDGKPSTNFCHPIECDPKENPFNVQYIRGSTPGAGEDIKMYDLGVFTIATIGSQGTSVNIGELWCSYDIELRKPQVADVTNLYGETAHYYNGGASTAANLGTIYTKRFDSIGLAITPSTITFPTGSLGSYYVTYWYPFSTAITPSAPTVVNGSIPPDWAGGTNTTEYNTVAAGVNVGFTSYLVQIVNPEVACVITQTGIVIAPAGTVFIDLVVTQVAFGFA
jgi:hypothetical protein